RERDVEQARNAPAPSSAAAMPVFLSEQQKRPVLNGRSSNNNGLPIGLFDDVFNSFHSDIQSEEHFCPDASVSSLIRELWKAFAKIYRIEEERIEAIRPLLGQLLGEKINSTSTADRRVLSDGIVFESCGRSRAYLVIEEVENEIGTGRADPSHQAGYAYRKYWAERKLECFGSTITLLIVSLRTRV
ncbi:hypothetical protein C0992_011721, partial [Termitomyces sp. T32_za158]